MSSTNFTPNYNLPQFIGTDKPAWLTDWNSAMLTIDSAIANVASSESGTAAALATLASQVETLASNQQSMATSLTTLTTTVTGNTGSINTINSLIGNGEPTTDDKTIIGAINELYDDIHGGGPTPISVDADEVSYDNQASGLTATDVQGAIDEIAAALPSGATSEVVRGTLAIGSTTLALTTTSQTIGANTLIDYYTSDFTVAPTDINVSGNTVTFTFDSQSAAIEVAMVVKN